MSSAVSTITSAFRMSDEAWARHANPWSVYTRFAAIPPLLASIWSRDWIGWWCLVPLAITAVWLWLNPHVFSPVTTPVAWASKGIFGEQIWAHQRDRVPAHHKTAFRWIAICGTVGFFALVWGLVSLRLWPTLTGTALIVVGQLWRIDRLVWMYEELHRPDATDPPVRR